MTRSNKIRYHATAVIALSPDTGTGIGAATDSQPFLLKKEPDTRRGGLREELAIISRITRNIKHLSLGKPPTVLELANSETAYSLPLH
jgi:hypothetical protein